MRLTVFCSTDPSRHGRTVRSLGVALDCEQLVEVVAPTFESRPSSVVLIRLRTWRVLHFFGPVEWSIRRNLTRVGFTVISMLPSRTRAPLFMMLSRMVMGMPRAQTLSNESRTVALIEEVLLAPAVFSVLPSSRKVLDMRDYYPRQFEHSRTWRLLVAPGLKAVLEEFLPRFDAVVTVSEELAALIAEDSGVRAHVVRSIPEDPDLPWRTSEYDPSSVIRLVHHGAVSASRRTKELVTIAQELGPQASLSLYLTGSSSAIRSIRRRARRVPNCWVMHPVPFRDIVPTLTNYDIGLLHLPPTTANLRVALPNKLFECLHAGLPVVVGPDTAMGRFVLQNECGWVAETHDPKDFAAVIAALTPDEIDRCRGQVKRTIEAISWKVERDRLKVVLSRSPF